MNSPRSGGILKGKKHSDCDHGGCGIKTVAGATHKEVEGGEFLLSEKPLKSKRIITLQGTKREIAEQLNGRSGFIDGKQTLHLDPGQYVINAKAMADTQVFTVTGTPLQIASAINADKGYGVEFEPGADINPVTLTLLGSKKSVHKKSFIKNTMAKRKSKSIQFPNSNLQLHGTRMDKSGNAVIKIGFLNRPPFSIQTTGNLPETKTILRGKKITDLTDPETAIIESEIIKHIQSHGSSQQKNRLKVYAKKLKKGGPISTRSELQRKLIIDLRAVHDLQFDFSNAGSMAEIMDANETMYVEMTGKPSGIDLDQIDDGWDTFTALWKKIMAAADKMTDAKIKKFYADQSGQYLEEQIVEMEVDLDKYTGDNYDQFPEKKAKGGSSSNTGIVKKTGFIVCQILGAGSLQPIFRDDHGQMFFDTKEAALAEINEAISDVDDAIEAGNMDEDSATTLDDYEIVPATLSGNTITAVADGVTYEMDREDDDWKELKNGGPVAAEKLFLVTDNNRDEARRSKPVERSASFILKNWDPELADEDESETLADFITNSTRGDKWVGEEDTFENIGFVEKMAHGGPAGKVDTTALAKEFSAILRSWLTPEQMNEVIALNKTPEYSNGACPTHNFCDANEAMLTAFKNVTGREYSFDEDSTDHEITTNAWTIAREHDFYPAGKKLAKGGPAGNALPVTIPIYNEDDYSSPRDYFSKVITGVLGPQNKGAISADWGGMPVWPLNDQYKGSFIIIDDDNSVILMTRKFDEETEEHVDNTIDQVDGVSPSEMERDASEIQQKLVQLLQTAMSMKSPGKKLAKGGPVIDKKTAQQIKSLEAAIASPATPADQKAQFQQALDQLKAKVAIPAPEPKKKASQKPHGEEGHFNIFTRDHDSYITSKGKHDRVLITKDDKGNLSGRIDHKWNLGEPTDAQILKIARIDWSRAMKQKKYYVINREIDKSGERTYFELTTDKQSAESTKKSKVSKPTTLPELKKTINSELAKLKKDSNYYASAAATDQQDAVFEALKINHGYDWEQDDEASTYFIKATPDEVYKYLNENVIPGLEGGKRHEKPAHSGKSGADLVKFVDKEIDSVVGKPIYFLSAKGNWIKGKIENIVPLDKTKESWNIEFYPAGGAKEMDLPMVSDKLSTKQVDQFIHGAQVKKYTLTPPESEVIKDFEAAAKEIDICHEEGKSKRTAQRRAAGPPVKKKPSEILKNKVTSLHDYAVKRVEKKNPEKAPALKKILDRHKRELDAFFAKTKK